MSFQTAGGGNASGTLDSLEILAAPTAAPALGDWALVGLIAALATLGAGLERQTSQHASSEGRSTLA